LGAHRWARRSLDLARLAFGNSRVADACHPRDDANFGGHVGQLFPIERPDSALGAGVFKINRCRNHDGAARLKNDVGEFLIVRAEEMDPIDRPAFACPIPQLKIDVARFDGDRLFPLIGKDQIELRRWSYSTCWI
jgi:hypothetical protein